MSSSCGNPKFVGVREYIESKSRIADRIKAIDNLIDAMILSMADTIGTSNISSYEMDDGQMRVATGYRSLTQVQDGIDALEKMKQMYVNRFNGRAVILRDTKTFR